MYCQMLKLNEVFHNKILKRVYYHTVINKKITPKTSGKRRVYLFGMPEHLNYGDVAIFVAEMEFLKKYLPDFEIVTIPERFVIQKIFDVKGMIDTSDIVALHGGGNMGDIWPFPDMIRQNVIREFGNKYRLICFPQSISYSSLSWINEMQHILKKCNNISMFARDSNSFKIMKDMFPSNVKCFLIPDIVMSLDKYNSEFSKKDILFLMRRDREKLSNPYYRNIKSYISKKYKYRTGDTVGDIWYRIDENTAPKRLDNKLKYIQKAKLIITDRLHGMIFAYITRTPVLVFDNNNHKIRNFYNTWFSGENEAIFFVNNGELNNAIEFINDVMDQKIKMQKIKLDYSALIKEFLS